MNDLISTALPVVFFIIIFYFLFIKPQKRQMEERNSMLRSLKAGDRVETVSRIFATIVSINDKELVLDIGENSHCEIKASIECVARVITTTDTANDTSQNT